jgi:serine/threonine protein phosphatase PrpC
MRSGLLLGREHTKLGAIAALAEGRCAIALSRGGYAKGYAHRDPNEDAAGYAFAAHGALLAVADGHGGHEAAAHTVATLLSRFGEKWTTDTAPLGPTWPARAGEALEQLHTEIVASGSRGGNPDARTTLALALARPGEALLLYASVGDSHVFSARAAEAVDLAQREDARPAFLGSPSLAPAELVARALIGSAPLAGAGALALATDGLSEHGIGVAAPEAAVVGVLTCAARASAELRPLEAARGLVECALASHRAQRSGDNVAAAVLWPGE